MYSQSYGFSNSHVWIWELDHKEGWVPKNWCFQTLVLEKTLEFPLGCKMIKLVNPKGNQPWVFIGCQSWSTNTLAIWCEERLIRKDPDAGKDGRQEEKVMTEDKMVGWPHWLNGHEFEQAPRDGKGQRSLACYGPWDHENLDISEWLNNKINLRDYSISVKKCHWDFDRDCVSSF